VANAERRKPMPRWLRGWIIDRDDATCYLCGLSCWPHEIHIDHVVPVSRGGDDHPSNLRVACRTCNMRKGKKMATDPPRMRTPSRPARPVEGRPRQPYDVLVRLSQGWKDEHVL
jgi:5-methylcytosine-specific restriction endonuclease McrA